MNCNTDRGCIFLKLCLFTLLVLSLSLELYGQENTGENSSPDKNSGIEEDGQGGAYYTIQKGDTLWDLSRKFLNSPWHWPELWEVNSDVPIPNPHLIYPGQKIRLFRKGEVPPVFPKEKTVTESETVPDTEIIPLTEPETEDIETDDGSPHFVFSPINQVGFIRKEPVSPSAVIFMEKDDKQMISKGDTVFLRESSEGSLVLGKLYTVYRTSVPLHDEQGKERIGIQHLMLGVVEIVQDEPDFQIGKVVHSFRNIRVDDMLMPYTERHPKIPLRSSQEGISGKILASEDHKTMMGEHDIAFINKGSLDGLAPGQQYRIYEEEVFVSGSGDTEKIVRTPMDFGTVLVLLAEESVSTVLIIRSQKNIHPGELVRSPVE
ncbi:MAG: LysM domain-containing protein [Desulfococcaceae bacterium]|nr:LysM domain-containing protein [Desulfococcaceae bacterium]